MKLVLVFLALLVSPAFADHPELCRCAIPRTLPADGAVGVPTNARFWRVPSTEPSKPIQSYPLAPHTGYVLQDTSFTTGADVDHEPPIAPALTQAWITLGSAAPTERLPVSILRLVAQTSADTAVIRIDIIDGIGQVTYYTTPDQLELCTPGIAVAPGRARVTITAYDLAGNPSSSDWVDANVAVDRYLPTPCAPPAARPTPPDDRATLGLTFLLSLAGAGLFLTRTNLRRRGRERIKPAPFALAAVEQLARAVRWRSLGMIALVGIATSYALHAPAAATYAVALSPLGALVLIDAVVRYIDAGRVRVLLRYDGVVADVQHDTVGVTVGKQRAVLRAAPRLVDRAREHALPRATL